MSRSNPVLDVPLHHVMRAEIALPLQHVLQIYTVGSFLRAWRNPQNQKSIEQVFDTPAQARHAAGTCAAWLNIPTRAEAPTGLGWWREDSKAVDA